MKVAATVKNRAETTGQRTKRASKNSQENQEGRAEPMDSFIFDDDLRGKLLSGYTTPSMTIANVFLNTLSTFQQKLKVLVFTMGFLFVLSDLDNNVIFQIAYKIFLALPKPYYLLYTKQVSELNWKVLCVHQNNVHLSIRYLF